MTLTFQCKKKNSSFFSLSQRITNELCFSLELSVFFVIAKTTEQSPFQNCNMQMMISTLTSLFLPFLLFPPPSHLHLQFHHDLYHFEGPAQESRGPMLVNNNLQVTQPVDRTNAEDRDLQSYWLLKFSLPWTTDLDDVHSGCLIPPKM